MTTFSRRDFLKAMVIAGSAVTIGCSDLQLTRIPNNTPPPDIVPGTPTWYATTCRECPAGCGMLAKHRDGRVIKVEGNPRQPISYGKLCPRGQASLHGLFNPDRFPQPLLKADDGSFRPISWARGESLLVKSLERLSAGGQGEGIVFLTDLENGTLADLIGYFLNQAGGGEHIRYHTYAYEALRTANRLVFGLEGIPFYRLDKADFLVSFGAGFLETWLSNNQYAHLFSKFHQVRGGRKNRFVFVGPRQSMTAANADQRIFVAPGDEYQVALAFLHQWLENGGGADLTENRRSFLTRLAAPFSPAKVAAQTGADRKTIEQAARRFAAARHPLALASGLPLAGPRALETAVAANLLCSLSPGSRRLFDFSRLHALGQAAPAARMKNLTERMHNGEVKLLLIHDANPVFTLPESWGFKSGMANVPLVVSFSSFEDETSRHADLILPTYTFLETWGDYIPQIGVNALLQPVMGNVFDTRGLGDLLLSTGRRIRGVDKFPARSFLSLLQAAWREIHARRSPDIPFKVFWLRALQEGGVWEDLPSAEVLLPETPEFNFSPIEGDAQAAGGFHFTAFPTVQFYDGRMANRMWIQELPDPLTQTTWGGWVEMHPSDTRRLNFKRGDIVRIRSPFGEIEAPVIPIYTVKPGEVAMPIGQGHDHYGRFASNLPANPLDLFPAEIDRETGGLSGMGFRVSVSRLDAFFPIAHTDGSFFLHQREPYFLEQESVEIYEEKRKTGVNPDIILPLPEGYDPHRDIYPQHVHVDYRWAMVVDLDRCIGCGACVVACYAENNVAVVGRDQVLLGREMSWIRVQRYFDEKTRLARWLVMLCQHCDCAPCESVCPIYAPQHSKEGLNNQVYNRCFGTRFCSQNDPYKVRRFNWFTFERPWPLDLQLNPDVTVRQKGVMEKCSFCIQRIVDAKIRAKNEKRKVRDDDFTTACAQTCPTDALVFGNLKNPESRVAQMVNDPRAFQVLKQLNTKPAVIYLKRLNQEL